MSLLKLLEQAQGGQGLAQLAQQFGLDAEKAQNLTQMLAPTIGAAAKERAQSGQAQQLLEAFRGEGQAGLFDDAQAAASPQGQAEGMNFLQNLLGGTSQADGLAQEAAQHTGVDQGTVAQFLPALAAMIQGGLQKNIPDTSIDGISAGLMGSAEGGGLMGIVGSLMGGAKQSEGGLGQLMQMLDADGDGSPLDDILEKFIKR